MSKEEKQLKEITDPKEVSPVLDASIEDLNVILEEIRPYIAMDGGDIQITKLVGVIVYVEMYGACQGCGQADMTLKHGLEELLKDKVHPDIEVCQGY